MIAVAIADDHEIVLRGLRMTIAGEDDLELLWEARNGREALEQTGQRPPDVLLLDVQMPEMDGIQAAEAIHSRYPQVAVVILTTFRDDAQLHAALKAGAAGYLLKDIDGDELVQAIRGAAAGRPQLHPDIARRLMQSMSPPEDPFAELTPREREVLNLIGRGMSNKEIALALTVTETTVKGYVSAILSKLGVADRTQAALLAVRYGLVDEADLPSLQ